MFKAMIITLISENGFPMLAGDTSSPIGDFPSSESGGSSSNSHFRFAFYNLLLHRICAGIARAKNMKCSFGSGAVVAEIRTSMPNVALLARINLYARDHFSRARQIHTIVSVGLLNRLSAGVIMQ